MAGRVCPFWMGYFLISPLRKFRQNPVKILDPYLHAGMSVLDFGAAMGYFSIPMAELVSPGGSVVSVDIQDRMLRVLAKRAEKAGVGSVVSTHLLKAGPVDLGLYQGRMDFVLLFAVAHEVPDQEALFGELSKVLKPGGKLLFSEPAGHVSKSKFEASIRVAEGKGFSRRNQVPIRGAISILLEKS